MINRLYMVATRPSPATFDCHADEKLPPCFSFMIVFTVHFRLLFTLVNGVIYLGFDAPTGLEPTPQIITPLFSPCAPRLIKILL